MTTLTLHGCAPVPLAHYLKALGIIRVLRAGKINQPQLRRSPSFHSFPSIQSTHAYR
jgi:hypothetical protein